MNNMTNNTGIVGKRRENSGKTQFVEVPVKVWEKIEEAVESNEELVDAVVVQKELHVSKKTLANMISSGKIPRNYYTIAVNGLKKFFNRKILGVEK